MFQYSLIIFLSLLASCKITNKSGGFKDSISTSEKSEAGEKFPQISIKSNIPNNGFALVLCDEKNECTERIIQDKQVVLKGLKPGSYATTVHECIDTQEDIDCTKVLSNLNITQAEYSSATAQNIFASQFTIENRLNELGLALYSAMKLHLVAINKCGSIPTDNTNLKEYLTLIGNLLKQGPISSSTLLSSTYQEDFSQLEAMNQNGLQLAGDSGSRSRVTLINYYYDKAADPLFEPGSWRLDPHALIEKIYGSKGLGHTALLIERYDPATKKWVKSTYISWPIGNSLEIDLDKYSDRKVAKMQLPEVDDAQLQKFHDWLKTTEFDPSKKDTKATELAEKRLSKKKEIGKSLSFPENSLRELTGKKENKKMLEEVLDHVEKLDKTLSESQKREAKTGWLEKWEPYQTWSKGKSPDELAQAKKLFAEYIDLEVETRQLAKPLSQADFVEFTQQRNEALGQIRRNLFLPESIDMAKYAYDFTDHWSLIEPEEVFQKYYRYNPRTNPDRFLDLIRKNSPSMADALQSEYASLAEKPASLWDYYKQKSLSPSYRQFDDATVALYRQKRKYGAAYNERTCNCARVVGESLDALYGKKKFFASDLIFSSPEDMFRRARRLNEEFNRTDVEGKGLATVAGLSVTAGVIGIASFYTGEQLNLATDPAQSCRQTAFTKFDSDMTFLLHEVEKAVAMQQMLTTLYQKQ